MNTFKNSTDCNYNIADMLTLHHPDTYPYLITQLNTHTNNIYIFYTQKETQHTHTHLNAQTLITQTDPSTVHILFKTLECEIEPNYRPLDRTI